MPADYTTLLVNGMPLVRGTHVNVLEFKLGQDYPSWQTIDANHIDDKSVLTVVAKQPVSLRCHHVTTGLYFDYRFQNNGQHKTKVVQFEPGKPLGEPWWALHATLFSFPIVHFTMNPSQCEGKVISRFWFSLRVLHPHPTPYEYNPLPPTHAPTQNKKYNPRAAPKVKPNLPRTNGIQ